LNVNVERARCCLQEFDFRKLFVEELNWDACNNRPIDVLVNDQSYHCIPFAELGGMVAYLVESPGDVDTPPPNIRRFIETKVKKQTHEHILIFVDSQKTKSVWQWVKRQSGKQTAAREHTYCRGQPGDSLLQKLDGIAFSIEDFDAEGNIAIIKVLERVTKAFDVEKVTKRFYDEFKIEHSSFCKFLKGLDNQDELAWYTSVMLDRLMFIYFIQKKGFLNGDVNYLANKLAGSKKQGANQFYRQFLMPLFFEGFAKEEKERSPEVNRLLGKIPYLNGGLFLPHQLELAYGESINISDAAFERLFDFFERYSWHLDYRPLKADNEINPDVLGYIFEKYVNQKQMGAYYTKEDITDYICKNTIIPFLFDKLETLRYEELHPFPMKDVEPYIYKAVKQQAYLPTETAREYQARQKRYQQIKADFAAGKITNINDLITYNLDIRKFAEDWAKGINDPITLRAFYFHCLTKVTILDPAVGSGAFLFAALNMLEPLYEICLDKMQELGGPKYEDFAQELARVNQHPNRKYFVFKSIIVNNLFGVDIMEEAVEICKLRLFLKLVAQIDDVYKIEPLPDIDFNIRAGNSLVGYVSEEEIKKAKATQLDLSGTLKGIEQKIENADRSLKAFRDLQTKLGIPASELAQAKAEVNARLAEIQGELDRDLAAFYGARDLKQFVKTHQPFHWFVEFYGIMKDGGFDVIIGNPPYVEYSQVRDTYAIQDDQFITAHTGNLYAFIFERAQRLVRQGGFSGFIVPISSVSTPRMEKFVEAMKRLTAITWISNYAVRPSKLFVGVDMNLTIIVSQVTKKVSQHIEYTTTYHRWNPEYREFLFQSISYIQVSDFPRLFKFAVPKLRSDLERQIMTKVCGQKRIQELVSPGKRVTKQQLCYRTAGGRYYKIFVDKPFDSESKSNKATSLLEGIDVRVVLAVLSSNLWWWYYTLHFDMYNCKDYMIFGFPFLYPSEKSILGQLSDLGGILVADLFNNAQRKAQDYATTGNREQIIFEPSKSKPIIDKIDQVLAKHYGLTEEELDFIINYDIKYRMGKDNDEQEEG